MKDIYHIWINELKNIFNDIGVILILFGAIIIYPIIYPIPYSNEVLKDIPIALVDLGNSEISRKLTRMLDANEFINITNKTSSLSEAEQLFDKGIVNGIIYLPKDFSKNILTGKSADLMVFSDGSYFLLYRQLITGAYQSIGTFSAGIEIKRLLAKGSTFEQAKAQRDPLQLISYSLFNNSGNYAAFVVPAVLILILQQTLLMGIGMLGGTASERNQNYFTAPNITSQSNIKIIIGKSLTYLSIYLIHIVYLFGIIYKLYQFPQRSDLFSLLIFSIPFLLSSIFLGIFLATIFRNREISIMIILFLSMPMLFLSGFSWPPEAIPSWLRIISYIIPSTLGIDGFLKLNIMGASFFEVSNNWIIMWGLVFIYLFMSLISLKYNKFIK